MIGKEYKLSFLGRFLKCDECGQTFYEGFRPKVPWKIRENKKIRHFCSYTCMMRYERRKARKRR